MCSTTRWQHPARRIFQQHYSDDEGWEMAHLVQLCGLVSYGRACRRRWPSMDPWAGAASQRRTLSSCKLINDQHQCITEILGRETKSHLPGHKAIRSVNGERNFAGYNRVRTLSGCHHEIGGSIIWPQLHLDLKMGGCRWGDNIGEENKQWSELNNNSCIDKTKNTYNQSFPVVCYFIFFTK
jgi:hypothetical protein